MKGEAKFGQVSYLAWNVFRNQDNNPNLTTCHLHHHPHDPLREKTKPIHSGCIPFQLSQIILTEGQSTTGLHTSYYMQIIHTFPYHIFYYAQKSSIPYLCISHIIITFNKLVFIYILLYIHHTSPYSNFRLVGFHYISP